MEWNRFWNEYPKSCGETCFYHQVGKTLHKQPVSAETVHAIISSIVDNLAIKNTDTVLDLCCGNGLITSHISEHCNSIVGVDFSEYLIQIANKYHPRHNISYLCDDVFHFMESKNVTIDKIYMYEALQHFKPRDFAHILESAKRLFKNDIHILLCSIPDRSRKWTYYNTVSRKLSYIMDSLSPNRRCLGTWWDSSRIIQSCKDAGLTARIIPQNSLLHTSHYRFDVLITN